MTAEPREQRPIPAATLRGRWSRWLALFVLMGGVAAFVVEAAWRYYVRPVTSVAAVEFTLLDPPSLTIDTLRHLVVRDEFLSSAIRVPGESSAAPELITAWKASLSTDYTTAAAPDRRVFVLRHVATAAVPARDSVRLLNLIARRVAEELAKQPGNRASPVVFAAVESWPAPLWRVATHGVSLLMALSLASVLALATEPAVNADPVGAIPAAAALQAEASAVFESRDPPARFASADDVARSLRLPVVTYRRSTET